MSGSGDLREQMLKLGLDILQHRLLSLRLYRNFEGCLYMYQRLTDYERIRQPADLRQQVFQLRLDILQHRLLSLRLDRDLERRLYLHQLSTNDDRHWRLSILSQQLCQLRLDVLQHRLLTLWRDGNVKRCSYLHEQSADSYWIRYFGTMYQPMFRNPAGHTIPRCAGLLDQPNLEGSSCVAKYTTTFQKPI